jgi:hypothetical protein
VIVLAAALAVVGLAHGASAQDLGCEVFPATNSAGQSIGAADTSNPHFFDAFSGGGVSTGGGQTGGGAIGFFSANNPPCDQIGSDGDNEQGLSGAQMPISGATCPYSQDLANEQVHGSAVTVGHHGDDIFVTNGLIDVTWSSGVDGQDPAATLAGQTCTGNGIVSDDATTDPADCSDSTGANINILGATYHDTDPLSAGTNDPASGFTCLDAVDGNEWTFLVAGPFVRVAPNDGGGGPFLAFGKESGGFITVNPDGNAEGGPCPFDTTDAEDQGEHPDCLITLDPDWSPPNAAQAIGFSLPIFGTIASGVEV